VEGKELIIRPKRQILPTFDWMMKELLLGERFFVCGPRVGKVIYGTYTPVTNQGENDERSAARNQQSE